MDFDNSSKELGHTAIDNTKVPFDYLFFTTRTNSLTDSDKRPSL